jgi:putative transposase
VRAVQEECLSQLMLCGEGALRHALQEVVEPYHQERPHQGRGNVMGIPVPSAYVEHGGSIRCRERLGGLLKCYDHEAA